MSDDLFSDDEHDDERSVRSLQISSLNEKRQRLREQIVVDSLRDACFKRDLAAVRRCLDRAASAGGADKQPPGAASTHLSPSPPDHE